MNRLTLIVLVVISVFSIITSSSISKYSAYGEEYVIPSWLKDNAKWWAGGKISDSEYITGIKYLIQHGIMQLEPKNNPMIDRKSTRLNSSHSRASRMPSSA